MRKLFVWVLCSTAALQVLLVANAVHQYVRLSFSQVGAGGKTVAGVDPLAAIELNMTNNTIEAMSWTVVGLIAGAIFIGFLLRARAALIGMAAVSFGVVLFFAGLLPYNYDDALIPLGIVALVAAGASALLEWRGVAFYKKAPAMLPEHEPAREEIAVPWK